MVTLVSAILTVVTALLAILGVVMAESGMSAGLMAPPVTAMVTLEPLSVMPMFVPATKDLLSLK